MINDLEKYRKEIDEIDFEILKLFSKRFELWKKIWEYKKQNWIKILQENRWQEVLDSCIKKWKELSLEEKFIKNIWEEIHINSINLQK